MPTYTYQCKKCEFSFEEFHSMSETVEFCKKCGSDVQRVLSMDFFTSKVNVAIKNKPGTLVKKYIEEVRDEVRKEKTNLSTKEYDIND
jgi:putative FmdB family regulatory protein